jgi:hypothetical protein
MMGGENKYGVVTDDFHDLKTFTDGSSICVGQTSDTLAHGAILLIRPQCCINSTRDL